MLWYKGWLEARFRLLVPFGLLTYVLVHFYFFIPQTPAASAKALADLGHFCPAFVAVTSIVLAGAGIATQPALQATKGLHGSMHFTLSLPVSRFRLLATRAALGWLVSAGAIAVMCLFVWTIPAAGPTAAQMLTQTAVLIACGSSIYCIAVLLATFLDDQWRFLCSVVAMTTLWWLLEKTPGTAAINIFRAMDESSPWAGHNIPWSAMAFSLGLAAILFLAALKIVQRREY